MDFLEMDAADISDLEGTLSQLLCVDIASPVTSRRLALSILLDYFLLQLGIGVDEIREHIDDGTIHYLMGAIDHTAIFNIGSHSHTALDTELEASETHRASTGIHVSNSGAALTLLNGWTSQGSPYGTPWVKKFGSSSSSVIFCQGLIVPGATTDGTLLFTLPADYCPAVSLQILCSAAAAQVRLFIGTGGSTLLYDHSGSVADKISLANIIFFH